MGINGNYDNDNTRCKYFDTCDAASFPYCYHGGKRDMWYRPNPVEQEYCQTYNMFELLHKMAKIHSGAGCQECELDQCIDDACEILHKSRS